MNQGWPAGCLGLNVIRTSTISNEYHLGTSAEELERLGFQHQVWLDVAVDLWRDAGFDYGQQLLDLGCGPGFGTTDLAHLVGTDGRIDAVDSSDRFLAVVKQRCQSQGLDHVTTHLADAHQLDLPDASVDGVFARWLLCFVTHPARVVEEAHRVLRPGRPLVIQDYFNYLAVQLFPPRDSFTRLFQAYYQSAIRNGGSYDVGQELPAILAAQGFQVKTMKPICRIAKPDSLIWRWFEKFTSNYLPKLVEQDLFTEEDRRAFELDFKEASQDPTSFFFPPPMVGIVAVKSA